MREDFFEEKLLRMVVFAGPNGSGKSTVIDGLKLDQTFPAVYINADDISRTELIYISDPVTRNLEAANLAERRRRDALMSGKPFAFETVMSTPGKLALFDEARAKGYSVDLIFVTTEDVAINLVRVENRVAKGGHFVDPDKIVERYKRTMQLLPSAIDKADTAEVYDNSIAGRRPVRVAWKHTTRVEFVDYQPEWVKEHLFQPIKQRDASRNSLSSKLLRSHPNAKINDANIGDGKCYSGLIVSVTDQHILQRISDTDNNFVFHDKILCAPLAYHSGKAM
ncbi:MAG: zeta toxin family protein, partial [Ottowia sp.]|nr:zeta toxin family protein [Ottowia sp.]